MPNLSRKKTSEEKRLLEHKLYLARERPDELFDLSACGLKEIPDGTFSYVKVLRKTRLLLQNNSLRTLNGGGKLSSLLMLTELNLNDNEIQSLPSEIAHLTSLKILLLAENRIQLFPCPILHLKSLVTLNLEGNQITVVPAELCGLTGLTHLFLDRNPITSLPKELTHLDQLQSLSVPVDSITTPPADVCTQGIRAILEYLGKSYPYDGQLSDGTDLSKPSTVPIQPAVLEAKYNVIPPFETPVDEAYTRHSANQRARTQELERHLQETQQAQFELAQRALEARKQVLSRVTEEDDQLNVSLTAVQQQRDRERAKFMCTLLDAEQSASRLIQKLLAGQAKARLMEVADDIASQQLLDSPDASFKLRREETLAAMECMLVREDEIYRDRVSRRDAAAQRALSMESVDSAHVDRVLARRDKDRKKLSDELASKEEAQREAFAKLFAQQDRQAQRLKHEIGLIEQELCRLTMVEQNRRTERTNNNQRTLNARRTELLELLIQLSRDQKKRQNELQQRLIEIEERKQQDQLDYWLIQYQRVLDHKPPELAKEVDEDVLHVLKAADSLDYLPNFRYHRITGAQLDGLTDEELQRIGVHSVGLRSAILSQIAARVTKQMNYPNEFDPTNQASAPPEELVINRRPATPTAPTIVTARVENECCVCQNSTCNIVFLRCAHVCTCEVCAERLTICPLCRAPILQRIHLQCY